MGGQTAGFRKSQPAMANTTAYCSREDPTAFYHLVISINRLTAIHFPFQDNIVFSDETSGLRGFACFIYSDDFWNFTFTNLPACAFITWFFGL
ncbi:unnamed protein product, partial [Mesorhabditis spiculigera]